MYDHAYVLPFKSLADRTINITTIRVVYLWLAGMLVTSKKRNTIWNGKLMLNDIDSIASSLNASTIHCRLIRRLNGRLDEMTQWKWSRERDSPVLLSIVTSLWSICFYRGYYTVARRYEFYVRVARTISHEWAQRTSEIILSPLHNK